MTIKVIATRNDNNSLHLFRIEVTEESIPIFEQLINRALNCWDNAPASVKELGDMLTHGRITQDHTHKSINSYQSRDYYTAAEQEVIQAFIESAGHEAWMEHLRNNTQHQVLKGIKPDTPSN